MTHYSDSPANVRVDFFKPSGKWYMGSAIDMSGLYAVESKSTHWAVATAVYRNEHLAEFSVNNPEFWCVCLEPYHEHAHPIMQLCERMNLRIKGELF